ncbi:hypothetical protein Zm00014a_024763 [Zea mays]|uniref:Uncharacterized protein n=1 Tax=Zea mays TaxID=4577 RepID=A0A3L6FMJ6_MAIZE|nr:hypothetical protein Zm00014a_024763 [Zea mays]
MAHGVLHGPAYGRPKLGAGLAQPAADVDEEETAAAAGKGRSFFGTPAPKGTTGRSMSKGIRLCGAGGHGNCGGAWSRPVKPCARRSARSWPCRCTPSHASKEISMRRRRWRWANRELEASRRRREDARNRRWEGARRRMKAAGR